MGPQNVDRFLIKDSGQTLVLNKYDSGSCIYGKYLDLNSKEQWTTNSVTMKLSNISPSGFGVGFATNTFSEFDGWNTGENGSIMIYGNAEFYTSDEFKDGNEEFINKNGAKLFPTDFMKKNDII